MRMMGNKHDLSNRVMFPMIHFWKTEPKNINIASNVRIEKCDRLTFNGISQTVKEIKREEVPGGQLIEMGGVTKKTIFYHLTIV